MKAIYSLLVILPFLPGAPATPDNTCMARLAEALEASADAWEAVRVHRMNDLTRSYAYQAETKLDAAARECQP